MELTIDQALQQAVAAHKEGKLQDAERLYRAILQAQSNHPDANHNLGVLAVAAGKPHEAIPLFKLALEANPKVEQFWLSYVYTLITLEDFDEAKRFFVEGEKSGVSLETLDALNQRLQASVTNDTSKTKKGRTPSEKRKKIAEKKKSKKSTTQGPSSTAGPSRDQINSLLEHYQTGRLREAEALATSLTQQFPKHPFGWKVLGAVLQQTGRIAESLAPMQSAVALSAQDAEAHNNLGVTLQELGRLDEAEASLKQALALTPNLAEAHSNLGNTLEALGRFDEAEASLRQALALKPDYAEAHYNLGNTLKELGRLDEAEASYRQAIALKPDYAEAHSNLGVTLKELGRLDEADASYKQAIALKPDYAEAHSNLGVTLQELGRLDESEASYRQAIALKPDFAEAYSNLGATLKKLGRLDEAAESYTQAVTLKLDDSSAKHLLNALSGNTTESAPLDYVERLFDNYASSFEKSLVGNLEYKIPKLIAEIILRDSNSDSLGSIMDLGCGTGLLGVEIKQVCKHLGGLDLSQKMLNEAKKKGIYDDLIKQDILGYLASADLNFDYFIATDVFVYVGDLSDVFQLIKSRNKTSGKLVFSTEHYDGDDFLLEQSGRYSHSKMYIEGLCEKFGYTLRHFETQPLRKDKNLYISGDLYILDF
jgi:predicted TPR repeat methyltransferase